MVLPVPKARLHSHAPQLRLRSLGGLRASLPAPRAALRPATLLPSTWWPAVGGQAYHKLIKEPPLPPSCISLLKGV